MDIPPQKENVYAPVESQNVNISPAPVAVPSPYIPSPPPSVAPVVAPDSPSPSTGMGSLFKKLLFGTGVLLGFAILIGSILMLLKKPVGTKAVATVKKADCSKSTDSTSKYAYKCTLEFSYIGKDGKEITTSKTIDTNTYYTTDNKITVYYSSDDPLVLEIEESNAAVFGWVLFGISIVILLGSGVGLYFAFRSSSPVSPVPM